MAALLSCYKRQNDFILPSNDLSTAIYASRKWGTIIL